MRVEALKGRPLLGWKHGIKNTFCKRELNEETSRVHARNMNERIEIFGSGLWWVSVSHQLGIRIPGRAGDSRRPVY